MLPVNLEKLVLKGKAKVGTATLGLSALSSFRLPDQKNAIVYSLGIHPFVDATRVMYESTDRYILMAHVGHVYELGDGLNRFSVADRSSFSNEAGTNTQGTGQTMIPQHGQTIIPVYWRFNANNIVLRIFNIPSNSNAAPTNLDTPPTVEQAFPGGYGTIPVVGSMEGYGGPGNTNYWQPDSRNPDSIPVQTRVQNARGLPTLPGVTPAIHPYNNLNKIVYGVYSMPLVNVQYVYFDETLTFDEL
jgi:hypothetical protein